MRWRQVLWFVTLAVVLVSGCSAPVPPTGAAAPVASAARQLTPAEFAAEVNRGERVVVNVHTPDEGSIAGTDAAIPFDQLDARAAELPQDRATPLALYCRTGRMSAIAVDTLSRMGYSDLVELEGGMVKWEADGRPLGA